MALTVLECGISVFCTVSNTGFILPIIPGIVLNPVHAATAAVTAAGWSDMKLLIASSGGASALATAPTASSVVRKTCHVPTPSAAEAWPRFLAIPSKDGAKSIAACPSDLNTSTVRVTVPEFLKASNAADADAPKRSSAGTAVPVSHLSTFAMTGFIRASIASKAAVTPLKPPAARLKNGPASVAPRRPAAAPMFRIAPCTVLPASSAAPPMPLRIARSNVAKSIWPLETMSETSADVLPSSSPSNCSTGTPRLASCSMSSPCSLPRAATEPKIVPISDMLVPAIVAVSPTVFRTCSSSLPGLMPAATTPAAVVAASSRPNAVPFTAAREFSMIPPTDCAECPRPFSFASACSIEFRRPMPFVSPAPSAAPAAAPTPTADFFRVLPMPEESFWPIDWPDLSAVFSAPPSAFATPGAIFEVSGSMDTYACANSIAITNSPKQP